MTDVVKQANVLKNLPAGEPVEESEPKLTLQERWEMVEKDLLYKWGIIVCLISFTFVTGWIWNQAVAQGMLDFMVGYTTLVVAIVYFAWWAVRYKSG